MNRTPPTAPLRRTAFVTMGSLRPEDEGEGGPVPVWGANGIIGWGTASNLDRRAIVVGQRGSVGTLALADPPAWVTNNALVVCPRAGHSTRFLFYALTAVQDRLRGVSTAIPMLTQEMLRATHTSVLDPRAERAIADFLDAETVRIDALIIAKRRMIELMEARLRSMATIECTSVGRDVPLRRAVSAVRTGTTPSVDLMSDDNTSATLEWVSPGDFGTHLELAPAARTLPIAVMSAAGLALIPAGSVAVVGIGATAGKVAHVDREVCSNQQVTSLQPSSEVSGRFLAWQLWARSEEIRANAPYTTLPILNNDYLRGVALRLPSLATQIDAAARLDEALGRFKALRSALADQLDLLVERRQALITAAVTGELEVPGVAA